MTLMKAQKVIQSVSLSLAISSFGLNRIDEKEALSIVDSIIGEELIKRQGCEFCVDEVECMLIRKSDCSVCSIHTPKFCPNCGKKLQRPIIEFNSRN